MKTRPLGRTGLAVSQVLLGCGNFGGVGSPAHLIGHGLSKETSFASLDEAVALGINVLDTAHSYTGGASERWIGEWLRSRPAAVRDSLHVATKVGNVVEAQGVRVDLSPGNILKQLGGSLERLGVPRVTFCMTHAPDDGTPIESTLEGFAEAIERGLVSHIGACNIDAGRLGAAMDASTRLGLPRYEWVQNEYNLLNRGDEAAVFRVCAEHGLGYTSFSPIAGGALSGRYVRGEPPPAESRLALRPGTSLSDAVFDGIDKLAREAQQRGCSPGALALAWVMAQPRVTAPVCGPSKSAEHLRLAREALAIELDEDTVARIAGWFEPTR